MIDTAQGESPHIVEDTILEHFFQEVLPESMADDLLVRSTAAAMQAKLAKCREKGKSGWFTGGMTNYELRCKLIDRLALVDVGDGLDQEDLLDIINYAAMMRLRILIYGENA